MLDDYLEINIQNKLKLFTILHTTSSISIKELSYSLKLGYSGIETLVNELNLDFKDLAVIEKKSSNFSLTLFNSDNNSFKLFYSIYNHSNVLHCLEFLITNDSKLPFSKFIQKEYLTKSSAYRIRQTCLDYLHSIGLDIKENKIYGKEYRIRFLIALLYCKYGINCCNIDETSIEIARNYILSTNKTIDMNFLDETQNVYGYFQCLLILLWKRKDYPLEFPKHQNFENFKKLFIYGEIKKSLDELVESTFKIKLSENDYTYIFLAYCCTDNCIFADKYSIEDLNQIRDILFSDKIFSDLLYRFEKIFGEEITSSYALRTTLIYFYQKCLLELQCIIPDRRCCLIFQKNQITFAILNLLTDILNSWKNANKIRFQIETSHLYYLSLQLEVILRQFMKPVCVYVVSSLIVDLEVMRLYLERNFSKQRIVISPLLLNKDTKKFLSKKSDSVIIVQKRFEQTAKSLESSTNNFVVPITIEMNDLEMNAIRQAIIEQEKKNFLDFIQNRTN